MEQWHIFDGWKKGDHAITPAGNEGVLRHRHGTLAHKMCDWWYVDGFACGNSFCMYYPGGLLTLPPVSPPKFDGATRVCIDGDWCYLIRIERGHKLITPWVYVVQRFSCCAPMGFPESRITGGEWRGC